MQAIRVKISSEAAGTIAITPVVVREMTFDELISGIVAVTGKDRARIEEVLKRGTVVTGGSRLRWEVFLSADTELSQALNRLPDRDPGRNFDPQRCRDIVLRAGAASVAMTRDVASRKRLFSRSSFWDHLMSTFVRPAYCDYSYAERADVYRSTLDDEQRVGLRRAASLLAYSTLATKVRALLIESIDFHCTR